MLDSARVPLVAVDPNRLYLHPLETISLRWNADLADYACIDGPIVCAKVGIGWDCRCP
jgi:hypothetical protein